MAGDTVITIVGNLVEDPNLRFTTSGQAVASFRVASTALFLTCNVWRQAAENVAESLQRGMRVIVQGRLKQRSYETQQGENRTVYEIEVDEVGPSLRSATAKVNKTQRQGGGGFGGGGGGFGGGSGGGDFGGGGGGQQGGGPGGGAPAGDPWATGGSGGGGGGFNDDPPF
jgi:single stranded DNA-binding protein